MSKYQLIKSLLLLTPVLLAVSCKQQDCCDDGYYTIPRFYVLDSTSTIDLVHPESEYFYAENEIKSFFVENDQRIDIEFIVNTGYLNRLPSLTWFDEEEVKFPENEWFYIYLSFREDVDTLGFFIPEYPALVNRVTQQTYNGNEWNPQKIVFGPAKIDFGEALVIFK